MCIDELIHPFICLIADRMLHKTCLFLGSILTDSHEFEKSCKQRVLTVNILSDVYGPYRIVLPLKNYTPLFVRSYNFLLM